MNPSKKRNKKFWAAAIGVICGAELVVAAVIGGAGLSALFGLEGLFVAAILVTLVASYFLTRRHRKATVEPAPEHAT